MTRRAHGTVARVLALPRQGHPGRRRLVLPLPRNCTSLRLETRLLRTAILVASAQWTQILRTMEASPPRKCAWLLKPAALRLQSLERLERRFFLLSWDHCSRAR